MKANIDLPGGAPILLKGAFDPITGARLKPAVTSDGKNPNDAILRDAMRAGAELGSQPKAVTKAEKQAEKAKKAIKAPKNAQLTPAIYVEEPVVDAEVQRLRFELEAAKAQLEALKAEKAAVALPKEEVVKFRTGFGMIKMKACVLEDEFSFALVFSSEDEITFIPEPTQRIVAIIGGKNHTVWYPNVTFTWVDGQTKILVLIKDQEDGRE